MSNASEVEECFAVESGSKLIDVSVISVTDNGGTIQTKQTDQLDDTSYLVFTEKSSKDDPTARKIGLVKIGSDVYYALEKVKSVVYKLAADTYLFPANNSTPLGQYLVVRLRSGASVRIQKQFEEIIKYFSTLVEDVKDAVPEISAIRRLLIATGQEHGLYPSLPTDEGQVNDVNATAPQAVLPPASSRVQSIANGIVTGAEYIASGLNYGTVLAESLVHRGGDRVVSGQTTVDTKHVDPKVISGLRAVRYGAETAASVSARVVDAVASGTRTLGGMAVPHIHKHGSKLLTDATGKTPENSSQTMSNILSVTASGFQGFGTIYTSVTSNAKTLVKAVADETVNYVAKRYGSDAGSATNDALYAAGSGYETATAIQQLGPKTCVKRAGIAVVSGTGQSTGNPLEQRRGTIATGI